MHLILPTVFCQRVKSKYYKKLQNVKSNDEPD